jgi:hypothetical protein
MIIKAILYRFYLGQVFEIYLFGFALFTRKSLIFFFRAKKNFYRGLTILESLEKYSTKKIKKKRKKGYSRWVKKRLVVIFS